MDSVKKTLEYILNSITQKDDNVTVEEKQQDELTIFEIVAPQEMIGKIIGKEGKIIKSIRNILNLSFPEKRFLIKIKD
jgi:hypothetical protein